MKGKINKERIIKIKSEKGAITLYVLLACLFFVFTLTGVYISNVNRLKNQEQDIKQIQENYARQLNRIDEIYDEIFNEGDEETTIKKLKVGDKVYYDTGDRSVGNDGIIECIVLYDEEYNEINGTNYGIQIITSDIIESITLGSSDFETSKESYNNALKILFDESQKYLNNTYAISSRCIGSNPADPDWDTNINEAGYYTREQAISQGKYFNYMNEHYGTFKNEDGQYDTDWTQIQKIEGARIASDNYWIASRLLDLRSDSSRLYIRYTNTYGNLSYYEMCYVFSSTIERSNIYSSGLRPVLTLKSDIKIIDGDGNTIPYTLAP